MNTLFGKIFLWFFLSVAVLMLTSYGMSRLISRDPANDVRHWGDPFRLQADYAAETLQRDGKDGLTRLLNRMDEASRMHAFVIDSSGNELRGLPAPPEAQEMARKLLGGESVEQERPGARRPFAYLLGAGAGLDSSVLVLMPPEGPRHMPIPYLPPHGEGIIVLLILVAGVLCYGLARTLTSPIGRLRRAVARLSVGDLSARYSAGQAPGGDEIAALGRDFDLMAERIESLVGAHWQLLRDVSHELRSPLARIRVAIGLAEHRRAGEEGVSGNPMLERIERETERLEALISQILTLSRLEARAGEIRWERVDLNALVQGVAEDEGFEAAANGVEVRFRAGASALIEGDGALLRSVIDNVVRNAVRVSARGAAVDIALVRESGAGETEAALITVSDRGPGVPEEELEWIFAPFTRSEKSRDRLSGGVGLGLAIARSGVESHGGRIQARLRAGGGLLVEIRLPLGEALPSGTPDEEEPA